MAKPTVSKNLTVEEAIYEKISAALDRFQEAHFWLHMVEQYYHAADPFRWHLNAFLRALKEVPQLLQMELQAHPGFKAWFAPKRRALADDPLIGVLSQHRDFVVHRGMLVPNSTAMVGVTEGRGMKFGMTFPIHALEDSDHGMRRYLAVSKARSDFLGILIPDEDSLPCVERQWRLPEFDDEIVEVCARAWLRLGETVGELLIWLGANPPPLSLDCRHASQEVHFKLYSRWMATTEPYPSVPPSKEG
jgi:hypothetical protein